ncbi:MAG: SDR family oxidoreductase [Phycisphaerales bacterium]|nr:SDR family oxidoreductase [Planctomycetota bacterium]MCH8509389.1 SDR family oxidoreductase [Phycisphaerales bacterium]
MPTHIAGDKVSPCPADLRCNCIQPAAILTPMWDPVLGEGPQREANLARFAASAPLHRFGTPEEVAALAVHLASDESAFTTGAEFNIDGGMLAGSAEAPGPVGDS